MSTKSDNISITVIEKFMKRVVTEYFKDISDKNEVPVCNKATTADLQQKALFYQELKTHFYLDHISNTYTLTLTFKLGNRKFVSWKFLVPGIKNELDLNRAENTLEDSLKYNFGSMPKTQATKVLYGV